MDVLFTLLVMFFLLLLKGFFSGSEIALVNADKLKLRHRAKQGHAGSRLVLKYFERPERLLGTTLVGTNMATVPLITLGTILMITHFGDKGELLAFLVFTPVMLIFGEVVPKSVYQQKADTLAPIIIYPLRFFSIALFPIIIVFSWIARMGVRIVSSKKTSSSVFVSNEKIRSLLESAEQAPSTDILDRQRIQRAIEFSSITAGQAMIPMADAITFSHEHNLEQAIALVRAEGYNRLPVFDSNASRIIGILVLTTWDLLDPDLSQRSLSDFMRPALFAAPSQPVEQLLGKLHSSEGHMAIVVDEFGSAIGLITVEDILEEVVGEIEDVDFKLHNKHQVSIKELEKGVYLADAHLSISELNEKLNLNIKSEAFHTIAGLMVARLHHLPEQGESIIEHNYRMTAMECDERLVHTVKIEREHR